MAPLGRAVEIHPGHVSSYNALGLLHTGLGDYDRAARDRQRGVSAQSGNCPSAEGEKRPLSWDGLLKCRAVMLFFLGCFRLAQYLLESIGVAADIDPI
jgi:hypothetical protein